MTDPGPISGDTSSQDGAVSAPLEGFSIFDQPLPFCKVCTFQTRDLKVLPAEAINISQNILIKYWTSHIKYKIFQQFSQYFHKSLKSYIHIPLYSYEILHLYLYYLAWINVLWLTC